MTNLISLKNAGLLIGLSALLHLVAIPIAGFGSNTTPMLVTAIIMSIIALGLYLRSMRWLAYFAFIGLLIGVIIAFGQYYSVGPVPSWLHLLNAALNLAALIVLFFSLWQPKQT